MRTHVRRLVIGALPLAILWAMAMWPWFAGVVGLGLLIGGAYGIGLMVEEW